jgi:hypothetical protein
MLAPGMYVTLLLPLSNFEADKIKDVSGPTLSRLHGNKQQQQGVNNDRGITSESTQHLAPTQRMSQVGD